MKMEKCIVLIESQLFLNGFEVVKKIHDMGLSVVLLCRDIHMYIDAFPGIKNNGLLYAEHIIHCETNDCNEVIKTVKNISNQYMILGILSFSDYYLDVASAVSDFFGLRNESVDVIKRIKNKKVQYDILTKNGIKVPVTRKFNVFEKELQTICEPVIVKPNSDSSSHGVEIIRNQDDFFAYCKKFSDIKLNERQQKICGDYLIQEYVSGTEISVEVFTENGIHHFLGVSSKEFQNENSFAEKIFSFPIEIDDNIRTSLYEFVDKALTCLGISFGCSHVEVKIDGDRFVLIEINPRLGGRYISNMIFDSMNFDCFVETVKLCILGENYVYPFIREKGGAAYNVLYSDIDGCIENGNIELGIENSKNSHVLIVRKKNIKSVKDNSDAYGYIYAKSDSAEHAKNIVKTVENNLDIRIS